MYTLHTTLCICGDNMFGFWHRLINYRLTLENIDLFLLIFSLVNGFGKIDTVAHNDIILRNNWKKTFY